MRIVCPRCSAVYEVPDSRLTAGRPVRCAKCGHEWVPRPASEAAELPARAPAPSVPLPAPVGTQPQAQELRVSPRSLPPRDFAEDDEPDQNRRNGAWAGWLVTIIVLAALCWAAYGWRDQVMQAWPPSIRVYAALGLTPPVPEPAPLAAPEAPAAPPLPSGQPAQPAQPSQTPAH